jgi:hypothetical protein
MHARRRPNAGNSQAAKLVNNLVLGIAAQRPDHPPPARRALRSQLPRTAASVVERPGAAGHTDLMQRPLELRRSTFDIPKMDCPSEERLIRLSLGGAPAVRELSFDLEGHRLAAVHTGPAEEILKVLGTLNMGATLATSEVLDHAAAVHGRHDDGAHMKASYIFSANDVIANAGVIVAGALVWWTGSRLPDLVIGAAIGVVVLAGARRILALR